QKVVVCGGGIVGLECAVMLGMEGKDVTVIDMIPLEKFAEGFPVFNHIELNYQLEKYGVKLFGNQKITGFTDAGVMTVGPDGTENCFAGDSFVLALGVKPDNALGKELLSRYAEGVYMVGDCVSTGRVLADANQEAFHAAIRIR
ncbi:MAG: FAD-dependent oxidoreductase, partial [Oscillospiraceae bacterium]|nr:FAD-dependent oxidoreductase [Oscillospiraceae bacterium]